MMINIAVIGAAGYTGAELVRWVLSHPQFKLVAATSDSQAGLPLSSIYPQFLGQPEILFSKHGSVVKQGAPAIELAFLAVPHTVAMQMAPSLLAAGICVVDLSADFRLADPDVYQEWYGVEHSAKKLLANAVYGLPELNFAQLQNLAKQHAEQGRAVLVANPGCYPTASALAAAPPLSAGLADTKSCVVVNAISGVSGAGVKATATTHFCSADENLNAYGVTTHRHTPEIAQTLSQASGSQVKVQFTPHLAPLIRGMVATVAIQLKTGISEQHVASAYKIAYQDQPFVQVLPDGQMPKSANVSGTNNAQIGWALDTNTNMLVVSCVIDNLGKGASAQAIQNANIIFGLEQTTGLNTIGQVI
jgi:N-acetyl-gamma-glutamyl-phosphate reductase